MFPRDAKEMYAAANQKTPVKEAIKRMKSDDRDEHSGWSAATAPMRKPGVSSTRTPFTAPTRGGIGGLGEAVFKVSQSRCLWPPPQKRHGPIFAVYGRSFPHLLFLTRGAVSVFVVMAATLAASLEITSRRSSAWGMIRRKRRFELHCFRTDFLRPSGGGEVSRSSSRAKMYWSHVLGR
jgi:hypothetical protein